MINEARINFVATVVFISIFSPMVLADKLDDFTKADRENEGCETIPYSSLQKTCKSQGKYVHVWCDGSSSKPVKCAKGVSKKLKKDLENEKDNYKELESKKRTVERAVSRSKDDAEKKKLKEDLKSVNESIDDSDEAIDNIKKALDDREKLVDKTIHTLKKCLNYRRAVMNSFADSLDKVRNEKGDGIKPLARSLRNKYQKSKRGHEIQIKNKKNALSTCKSEEL
ncbi:hypothetical protein MNBD_GAMMA12-1991 [hydrothermal vent metagenome]|uniref:Uncharacterized protein n=1 Tax=hydrothermal vent metagenome TaxID=652676 RepID=A0A3B0Z2W8_9ZZZZ